MAAIKQLSGYVGCTLEPVVGEAISGRSDDGNWPPVGVRGGARKLTIDAMALLAKVSLRRPPRKPGPGQKQLLTDNHLNDRFRLVAVTRIWPANVGGRPNLTLTSSSGRCPLCLGT